jgi:hypothetical protein
LALRRLPMLPWRRSRLFQVAAVAEAIVVLRLSG